MVTTGEVETLKQKQTDYLVREQDALAQAASALDAEHRSAIEQVAKTWRLLAEITSRTLADLAAHRSDN